MPFAYPPKPLGALGPLQHALLYKYLKKYIKKILPQVLGHPLLMKGLTTLVISMSTNLNVFFSI